MIGKFRLSLRHVVRREVRAWRRRNTVYREHAGTRFERVVHRITQNPIRFWISTLLVLLITVILLAAVESRYGSSEDVPFALTSEQLGVVLNVQLALAALVYATLFAVIAILLQRGRSDLSVRVYLAYTGGHVAGIVSIILLMVVAFSQSVSTPASSLFWHLPIAVAFFLNLLLTMYFVLRTFRFLAPSVQQQALLVYTATVVWPEELYRHLMMLRFREHMAVAWPASSNINVFLDLESPGFRAIAEISDDRFRRHYVHDVWLRPLRLVARRWARRASRSTDSGLTALHLPLYFHRPLLDATICRRSGDVGLTFFERLVIRRSVRLSWRPAWLEAPDVASIVEELGATAKRAVSDDNGQEFDRALQNLLEFHRTVIGLADSGRDQLANYLTERFDPTGSMETLDQRLLRPYRALTDTITQRLVEKPDEFDSLAYAPYSLLAHASDNVPADMRRNFLFLARYNWIKLVAARAGQSKAELTHSRHLRRLTTLCSVWDSTAFFIVDRFRDENDWEALRQVGDEMLYHLESTGRLVFAAIEEEDFEAARWAIDLVQRWLDYWDVQDHADWKEFPLVDGTAFASNWDDLAVELGVQAETVHSLGNKQKQVFAEILVNEWHTTVSFLCAWLAAYADQRPNIASQLLMLANALHRGEALQGSGTRHAIMKPYPTFDDAFAVWIRNTVAYGYDIGRNPGQWGRFYDASKEVTQTPWVSGRVYGSGDGTTVVNLAGSVWLPLIAKAIPNAAAGPDLVRQLLLHCDRSPQQRDFAIRQLEQGVTTLNDLDLTPWQAFLQSTPGGANEVAQGQAKTILAQGLQVLIAHIRTRHDEKLAGMAVSPERITAIETRCNHSAAHVERGAPPVSYFDAVALVDTVRPTTTGRLPMVNKAELVTPQLAPSVSNEGVWYTRMARDHVAVDVTQKILARIVPEIHACRTAEAFASALNTADTVLLGANLSSLLFVGSRRDANSRWRPVDRDTPKEEWPIRFEKLEGFVDPGYIGHVNGIPAILVPIQSGTAFLVPRELFRRLEFSKQDNGRALSLHSSEEADNQVKLDLTWAAHIDLQDLPVHEFHFEADSPKIAQLQ